MYKERRILYIGNFGHLWNTEEYIAKSFEALGHKVKRVQEDIEPDDIIRIANSDDFDFMLYARFRVRGKQDDILKEVKIPKVCWFFDVYPETRREHKLQEPWIQMADYFFSTDNGHQEYYKKIGLRHRCIRQGIFHAEAFNGTPRKKFKTKIFFAGAQNHWFRQRQKFVDFMQRTYKDDFRWPRRTTRQIELNDSIASAEIVVGHNIRFPHYWSNRIYETLGRGGFLITPSVAGLEEEFEDKKHIVCYKDMDFDDLKSKIDHYLEHKDEREKIRQQGVRHCRENFTYIHRVKELLNYIYENNNSNG